MQEVCAWHRHWEQYFEVSALGQAGFNIQKSIFLQCISEEMLSRLDSEFEDCTLVEKLKHLVQEEFDKRKPRMVLRQK